MSDDDCIGVGPGLNVFVDFEGIVEFFGGLADVLLSLLWYGGHLDGSEAVFVFSQVVLQGGDELSDDDGWHDDAGGDLVRLLHSEQKIDDEFVLSLQDDGTGGEDASGDMCRHECTDGRVSDFLTLRSIRIGLIFWMFCHDIPPESQEGLAFQQRQA